MLERVTIEAREVRAGDIYRGQSGALPPATVSGVEVCGDEVEVFSDHAGPFSALGMPLLTVPADFAVTVWREVSR